MTLPKPLAVVAVMVTIGQAAIALCAERPDRPAGTALPDCIRQYEADHDSVVSFYRLPASDVALEHRQHLDASWLKRLQGIGFDRLDQSGKVDYVLLANDLQESLDHIGRQRKRLAEIDRLLPFRKVIDRLEEDRWRAVPLDYRAAATRLSDLAGQVKRLREEVEKAHKAKASAAKTKASAAKPAAKPAGPKKPDRAKPSSDPPPAVSPSLALRAGTAVKRLQETLKRWFNYYHGYQPDFDWWIKKPYDEAAKQLDEYGKLLREEIAGQKSKADDPLVGDPIGPEAVAADIRFQFLPYSADELIALGERELAWGEREMKKASRAMGLGDDWKAALAKVKADFVPPGRQDALIEKLGREATEFVTRRKLVTVPPLCRQTWRMTMISPEGIKTMPYAAYGGQEMLVAYARDDMSQPDKLMVMRGNNRHFMRLVVPHELIPGHHLQLFYAARHNDYRRLFSTSFYVEGWAFYWELRLWDLGWAKTPEDRIGMLFWRMTRAARIIVSLKYHLGRMKPPEMVDFLVNRVGHEKLGATSEVRRFISASPLYQCGYMVGGLQFYALHKELVGTGKMTEEQFHDAVLEANTMPVELLRAELLRLPLARNARPAWRFIPKEAGGQDAGAKVGGEGHRITVGTPDARLPVVVVRGTPYEMGWRLGRLIREDMQRFLPAALSRLKQDLGVTDQTLQEAWKQTSAYDDDRFKQELRGLSDGSGLPMPMLENVHVIPLLMPYSCSSVAAWGKATADGHLYQTRNLDWKLALGAQNFPVVVVYLPARGIAHVVPTFCGVIGAHTGMNVRGIVLSEMGDSPAKEAPYDLKAPHFTVFFRTLLYDADSLSRALEIFKGLPHTKRYHFVFGDGRVEHRAVKIRAHAPEPPGRRLVIWKDNDPADEFAPRVLKDIVYNDEGRGAFPLLERNYGSLNAEKMIQIANHIPIRGGNVVDVVYDATALRLWVSYAKGNEEAYKRPYTFIDLMKLDADKDGKPDLQEHRAALSPTPSPDACGGCTR